MLTTTTTTTNEEECYVKKRDGTTEVLSFDKILKRVKSLGTETVPKLIVNYSQLVMKVVDQLYNNIPTYIIDELTAEQCASLTTKHLDYGTLASRIIVSNNHKNTISSFAETMDALYQFHDIHSTHKPLIHKNVWQISQLNQDFFQRLLDYSRDYLFDYFGFKTLERAYLMKIGKKIIERPQHMWLRVSIGIHGDDLPRVKETYELLSQKYFTHATPTLFNAGTNHPQLSSCYLLGMESDSIDGIYNTLKDCAKISKWAGGVGLHIHNIRAAGTHINGTNGESNGIVPMLRVFNMTARYVDQCFTPETIVYTLKGPKPIREVGITDQVLTSKNIYSPVRLPVRHEYNGQMLEICVKNALYPVRVTNEHQLMTLSHNNITEFCDAKNLIEGDYIVYPIPTYEADLEQFSLEDCRFYGILLGIGYFNSGDGDSDAVGIRSSKEKMHADTINFVRQYLYDRGIKATIPLHTEHFNINWSIGNPGFKITKDLLYNAKNNKCINSALLHLPIEKIKQMLIGLVETVGNINTLKKRVELRLSPAVSEGVRYLLLRFGCLPNYSVDATMYIPPIEAILNIQIDMSEKEPLPYVCSPIVSIKETHYEGIVYDFEIVEPHDYTVAHLGLAHNGGGKRNGSFAIYLEPWHADIEAFIDMKKNHGDEEMRARDLFYALWIPDLFMKKVKNDEDWALFCPHQCPGLADCYGEEFNTLYETYCREGKANKIIKARTLWFKILDSQMETGTPYLLYKDAANKKSNQQNLGVIKSSNLCVAPETLILTDKGYFEINSLENKLVNVWNGEEFSATTIHKTGIANELITIETSDGCTLDCTPYHKFYIQNADPADPAAIKTVEAQHLQENDKLIAAAFPLIDGKQLYDSSIHIVPINASVKTKMEWVSKYYNSKLYNSIIINGALYLTHTCREFLLSVKLMLQLCGINTNLTVDNTTITLIIYSSQLYKLVELGFKSLRVNINGAYNGAYKEVVYIKKIINKGRIADTYCFNEPKKHAGIFNGLITSQCTEILEYSDAEQTAVCNLASIGLPKFVLPNKTFDYEKLHAVTKVITFNLNRIIDVNFYPTDKTRLSNLLHRPIGIGVQGLADVFALLDINFTSDAAREINKLIFETIYHASLESSMEISHQRCPYMQMFAQNHTEIFKNIDIPNLPLFSKMETASRDYITHDHLLDKYLPIPAELYYLGGSQMGAYSSFGDSPAAKGILQFDMWGVEPASKRYDWEALKLQIKIYGLRNSLLVAPMPTASTSQILGNNECFEPFTSNLYSRRTNAGEFVLPNKYLMRELLDLGLWNETLKDNIILHKGSIQLLPGIPDKLKEKYKTVWEMPMKHLIDMAVDRGPYICQSQSLNLWLEDPSYKTLTAMHFYSWQAGLKTGIYYLRRKAKHQAQQFTIQPVLNANANANIDCEMCSA